MDCAQEPPGQANGPGPPLAAPNPAPESESPKEEILPANLRALEAVYSAAMLEEAHLYTVVNRLVIRFSLGLLPVSPGRAGALLYRRWKNPHGGLTAEQRRNVYARAFGLPGADASVQANDAFNDLWVSFISIVGMYSAELQSLPPHLRSVSPEEVLVSGRALAVNLSVHGHGLAWFAAQDFKPDVQNVIELLSDSELQSAFGAKTPWELLSRVALAELGANPNVGRALTRAQSGALIMRWLSNRRARLLRPRSANILKPEDICEGRTAASQNKKATVYPTDADLVMACEQWLGVTGTQEAELKECEMMSVG